MENISNLTDRSFKVHNTWDFQTKWETGGKELMLQKILLTLKTVIKGRYDLGRVSKMYYEQGNWKSEEGKTATFFYYETKQGKVSVVLAQGMNLNRGTWYRIVEIKFV
jgi:hypothetical protein